MLRLPTTARMGAKLMLPSASDATGPNARLFPEACATPVAANRGRESRRRYSQADASSAR
jgi:hypothetical protein